MTKGQPAQVSVTYTFPETEEWDGGRVTVSLVGGGYALEGKNSDLVRVWGRYDNGDGDSVTLLIPVTRIDFLSYGPA